MGWGGLAWNVQAAGFGVPEETVAADPIHAGWMRNDREWSFAADKYKGTAGDVEGQLRFDEWHGEPSEPECRVQASEVAS